MRNIDEAIQYFEDAICESEEIIGDCSPCLQAELTKQKGHFEVALSALYEMRERRQEHKNDQMDM